MFCTTWKPQLAENLGVASPFGVWELLQYVITVAVQNAGTFVHYRKGTPVQVFKF
jgi:hypothetical protein